MGKTGQPKVPFPFSASVLTMVPKVESVNRSHAQRPEGKLLSVHISTALHMDVPYLQSTRYIISAITEAPIFVLKTGQLNNKIMLIFSLDILSRI